MHFDRSISGIYPNALYYSLNVLYIRPTQLGIVNNVIQIYSRIIVICIAGLFIICMNMASTLPNLKGITFHLDEPSKAMIVIL
jgi:hypothetical protein